MRLLAFAATVLGLAAATDAAAQAKYGASAAALSDAAFAPAALAARDDPIGALLDRGGPATGPRQWRSGQLRLSPGRRGGSVDSVFISTGQALRGPIGLATSRERAIAEDYAYNVGLVRDWPNAVSFGAGKFNLDVSPHASFGVGSAGRSAEAGATVRLGRKADDEVVRRLNDMGVRDGADFGDTGRWYLFVAASGRAVGLNLLRGEQGWDRQGWSTDPSAATIADAQVGVGWRSGAMQTSLGYVRREVKTDHKVWGQETKADSLVALTFSIRPGD